MDVTKASLQGDLTEAMRAQDKVRAGTLRMVLTAITVEESAGTHHELGAEDVQKVVAKEAKKRREAAAAYTEAGRPELAAQEEAELAILEGYLPTQLTEAEVVDLIEAAVAETGATGMPQMGLVMKSVTSTDRRSLRRRQGRRDGPGSASGADPWR
jgi:uncharacterized protein YqeY